jgi:hypothetical protein
VDAFSIEFTRRVATMEPREVAFIKAFWCLSDRAVISAESRDDVLRRIAASHFADRRYVWHGRPDVAAAEGATNGVCKGLLIETEYRRYAGLLKAYHDKATDPQLKAFLARELAAIG